MGFLGACMLALPLAASAQSGIERIESFNVTAQLNEDRSLRVTESITYSFGTNERHGIFRFIPTVYDRNGGKYRLRLEVLSIKRDGKDEPYKIDNQGDNISIRIGDPDLTITGAHLYEITYDTDRAINFFDGEGELYWNVTGDKWEVEIAQASISLSGPETYVALKERIKCFTGPFGSIEEACSIIPSANKAEIRSNRPLMPYEGLTVALRFPPGLIVEPTFTDGLFMFVKDNGILGLPIIVFLVMYILWHRRGRDPKGRGTVIPQYEPLRGLMPMEMHALKHQNIDHSGTTATIIDLARRGFLKINFGENKKLFGVTPTYRFVKQKEADETLNPFETTIFEGLFESGDDVDMTSLKGTFHTSITKAEQDAFESLQQKKLFGHNPGSVRATYLTIAFVAAMLLFWTGAFLGGVAIFSALVSALIIAGFGWFMPRKTHQGAIALEEVEGFNWFLRVTEKDRLKFHNAPKLKPETFHAYLPYAIAFGVEEEWAAQFKDLAVPEPDYATGYGTWNTMHFANSMHALDAKAATAAYAAPSSAGSGGSGFSGGGGGGGFGGGGGGSW